ncbi:MAG: hypothetical protein HYX57_09080 [Chloroflexi bacterium]|nr:hypothetical protein [Chloroflexota bacterium]
MADPGRAAAAVRRLAPVIRLAPAKLNLTLAVLGTRPDGFHDLHSIMVPLGLADRLSIALAGPGPGSGADSLRVDGLDAGPVEENLVLQAVAAARTAVGGSADAAPLAIRLEKRIPVAAGLGGGSSDAAAAIDAALEAWGLAAAAGSGAPAAPTVESAQRSREPDPMVDAIRRRVAAQVGSDVPFFLAGGAALVEGRGELVSPLPGVRGTPPGVLLVTPATAASTPAVFAAWDRAEGRAATDPRSTRASSEHLAVELRGGLGAADLVARAGVLASANDLLAPAGVVIPGLIPLRRALMRALGRPVGLSGSGPTLWVLYPSTEAASEAARQVDDAVRSGSIVVPGSDPPSIIATTIAAGGPDVAGAIGGAAGPRISITKPGAVPRHAHHAEEHG